MIEWADGWNDDRQITAWQAAGLVPGIDWRLMKYDGRAELAMSASGLLKWAKWLDAHPGLAGLSRQPGGCEQWARDQIATRKDDN